MGIIPVSVKAIDCIKVKSFPSKLMTYADCRKAKLIYI